MTTDETETTSGLHLTTDVVLMAVAGDELKVLVIRRGWEPEKGKLAFPGGHVDWETGELIEDAARRELHEETGIKAPEFLAPLPVRDDPARDPRGRVIGHPFVAIISQVIEPTASADPEEISAAEWIELSELVSVAADGGLAFDHRHVLADVVQAIEHGLPLQQPGPQK